MVTVRTAKWGYLRSRLDAGARATTRGARADVSIRAGILPRATGASWQIFLGAGDGAEQKRGGRNGGE